MISVTFTADVENIVATEHLYQWDKGQKLSISGVGTTADIHFANKKSEKALVVTPTVTSGAMEAPIPNSLLADPYPIIAYVYVPSDDGARTIKTITIFTEARKQPSDFVLDEDEGITTIETISQRANEVLQDATNQINTSISDMQTDYTNFKNTIQGELADIVANTTIPNADTLDGHHASDFANECNESLNSYLSDKSGDIRRLAYLLPPGGFTADTNSLPNITFPFQGTINITWTKSLDPANRNSKYGVLTIRPLTHTGDTYICSIFNTTAYTDWQKLNDGGNANTANTAGTLATTPTNVCLRNISFGTANPQVTDPNAEGYVAEGALYGQYV